ncbi:uncharacterized protein LOC130729451 [Lotus japonicus]|uniref:Uncharacterized protein n=1 Tax=Lotus japonicus TaxID=34305 RepID=I3SRK8_LOTJA|nr:uncharacterized protein LOC130729451 [Lotus japonicus]AFK42900.1 unknown [Lotus japonicus]
MAKLALSFAAFLILFTFSHARDLQQPFPDSDSDSDSDSNSDSNSDLVSASERITNIKPEQHDTVSLSLESVDPVPLTILSLRPIDGRRHVHPRRPCHHRREIHYGNDGIVLTDGARRPFLRSHSKAQRLPEMEMMDRREIHYGNDAIVLTDGDRRPFLRSHSAVQRLPEMEMMDRHDVHHYRRHHAHGHHHHDGWLSEKVRDFMNMF